MSRLGAPQQVSGWVWLDRCPRGEDEAVESMSAEVTTMDLDARRRARSVDATLCAADTLLEMTFAELGAVSYTHLTLPTKA